jgi:hypothetical protein
MYVINYWFELRWDKDEEEKIQRKFPCQCIDILFVFEAFETSRKIFEHTGELRIQTCGSRA